MNLFRLNLKDAFANMTDRKASDGGRMPAGRNGVRKIGNKKNPEWANGLRQLYDSVVDEPLPDQFRDLLSQLDSRT